MAFMSKNPEKAKYRVHSVKRDGTKMQERCDNKEQVLAYHKKISAEGRDQITVCQVISIDSLRRKR
jgi:hypothetical protein